MEEEEEEDGKAGVAGHEERCRSGIIRSQATSLSLSLTLIAFVRAMPTQQSKCDVQYQPDSEVVQRPLKTDQVSLGNCG